jgi:hypothetical protein
METTVSEAARAYGVFPGVFHRLILMGRLQARRNERGHWLIRKDSLERWNAQRLKRLPRAAMSAAEAISA